MNQRGILVLALWVSGLVVLAPHDSNAEDREWQSVGESGMGPWQVYIDKQSIKRDDRGHIHVHVLDDHRVTLSGVDRFDDNGDLYRDKGYQHRSTITHYVLDCEKQEEVSLSIGYYDGDMGRGNLVLFERPSNVYWSDILFFIEPKLTSTVCRWPNN